MLVSKRLFRVALEQRLGLPRVRIVESDEQIAECVRQCQLDGGQGQAGMATVANQEKFFLRLGQRIRELRRNREHSQEDMISYGFSARHWQQIEAGRPITVATLLRICAAFETSVESLVRGLDRGIYKN